MVACIFNKTYKKLDYEGDFPASAPNTPFLGCRGSMSCNLIGEEKIICFGGKVGASLTSSETEYEFSADGIGYTYFYRIL